MIFEREKQNIRHLCNNIERKILKASFLSCLDDIEQKL